MGEEAAGGNSRHFRRYGDIQSYYEGEKGVYLYMYLLIPSEYKMESVAGAGNGVAGWYKSSMDMSQRLISSAPTG